MSHTATLGRRGFVPVLVLALFAGLLSWTSAMPSARADTATRAQQAADLLSKQVRQSREASTTTVSNLYDYLLAFAIAGDGDQAYPAGRAWSMLDSLSARVSFADGSVTQSKVSVSGVPLAAVTSFDDLSKVVHIAAVYHQDPSNFGGRDVTTSMLAYAAGSTLPGWFRSSLTGTGLTTTISQARGILALDAIGNAQASAAATALIGKQLASGAFATTATGTAASLEPTLYAIAALVAEGSPASVTAAQSAATYVASTQAADGTFSGSTAPALVGLAASVLATADQPDAAAKAKNYVVGLQAQVSEAADPLYGGGIAPTATARAAIVDGTYSSSTFSAVVTPTLRGIFALSTKTMGDVRLADVGTPRPAVTGDDTFKNTACTGNEGVTVVVDTGYLTPDGTDPVTVRCALGSQATGWAALENAGILVESVPSYLGSALCKLQSVPSQGYPFCWTGEGYWSYWHAKPGEVWIYSQQGASGRTPEAGSVDGWRFVPLNGAGVPPRVGPTFADGIDVTAPILAFTSGPEGTVLGGKKLVFTYTVDDSGAQLECRLDDQAWAACDSPATWDAAQQTQTLRDVPDGDHTLTVRATDSWGNSSTITRAFTVVPDTVAPTVTITSGPGTRTNVTSASFTMTVDDADATVQCRLDDAEWGACTSRTSHTLTGLTAGDHVFSYRATDLSDNTGTVSYSWTIDPSAPPVVQITSGPSGYGSQPYSSSKTSVSVGFKVNEAGTVASTECRLDDTDWAACTSRTTATFSGLSLADGSHFVQVRATNAAGSTSAVATYTWTVDTVAPVVAVTSQPPAETAQKKATIAFTVTDTSPVYLQNCSIDGAAAAPCSSPLNLTGLGLGDHSVQITVRDVAYNYGTPTTTVSWKVVEPVAATVATPTVSSIGAVAARASARVTAGNLDQSVVATVTSGATTVFTSPAQSLAAGSSDELTFDLSSLASHSDYQVTITSTDANGAAVASEATTFTTLALAASVVGINVSSLEPRAVTVRADVIAGDLAADVWVEYRANAGASQSTAKTSVVAGTAVSSRDFRLTGLGYGTSYEYRVWASNAAGTTQSEWGSFTTPRPGAPSVTLTGTPSTVVARNAFTRSWKVTGEYTSVVASGAWSGALPASGSQKVTVWYGGNTYTYRLTATGPGGSTTATMTIRVLWPAATLRPTVATSPLVTGSYVTVRSSGLGAGEAYTIRRGTDIVYRGKAPASGVVSRSVLVPAALAQGTVTFSITGSQSNRYGSVKVPVAKRNRTLGVTLKHKAVRAGYIQTVTVSGLVPGERVTVLHQGARRSPVKAVADKNGRYTVKYLVGPYTGTKTVTVKGMVSTRQGKATFRITPRNGSQGGVKGA